jgi:hypothetical protein
MAHFIQTIKQKIDFKIESTPMLLKLDLADQS